MEGLYVCLIRAEISDVMNQVCRSSHLTHHFLGVHAEHKVYRNDLSSH